MTNIFNDYKQELIGILETMVSNGELPEGTDLSRVTVEPPRDASHGDMATNAAMVLSKAAKKNPRQLAEVLVESIKGIDSVNAATIAGPGFINFHLNDNKWCNVIKDILSAGTHYGDSDMGQNKKVNIEYVSANPTGPLTAGHARGAVIGDALATLLDKAGFDVTREYYINDAGAQVEKLARSTYLRYQEALGNEIEAIPEGLYPGDYLKDVAKVLVERDGDKWLNKEEAEWLPACKAIALEILTNEIKRDLKDININQDVFSSEAQMIKNGAVEEAFAELEKQGLIYTGVLEAPKGKKMEDWEERPQTLFKATQFGDDVDRPLKKSDGSWTYFANDIAYHYDKFKRGSSTLIDILGADHGGYVKRIKAAVRAVSGGEAEVDVLLCQLVKMSKNGVPVKMSKRAGTFVTLRDVVDNVGADALRFIMLTRKSDQTLDFDFDKAIEQSKDNPVFYVQYAHARCCSIFRNAKEMFPDEDLSDKALELVDMSKLNSEAELQIIRFLAGWPRFIESAAEAHEPHRISFYLQNLAAEFHAFWNKGREDATLRFLIEDDKNLSLARVALVRAVANVIASGLEVIGVEPVEEMH